MGINDYGKTVGDNLSAPALGGTGGWAESVAKALSNSDVPVDARIAGAVPVGAVVMFGAATPPAGWALCDGSAHGSAELAAVIGSANTPNLLNRFVLAAGGAYPQGGSGGTETHTHAAGSLYAWVLSTAANLYTKRAASSPSITASHIITGASGGTSSVTNTGATGVGGTTDSGNHMPPYYALTFIIKKGAT